eukprot:scaffold5127_cov64-Phaeocystis_antarctica.AAC.8
MSSCTPTPTSNATPTRSDVLRSSRDPLGATGGATCGVAGGVAVAPLASPSGGGGFASVVSSSLRATAKGVSTSSVHSAAESQSVTR